MSCPGTLRLSDGLMSVHFVDAVAASHSRDGAWVAPGG